MCNDHQFRADAVHIEETGHKEAADLTGISGLAILAQLPSIEFPRSFPPDSMHLFFENVLPALVRHYRGVFSKQTTTQREPEQQAIATSYNHSYNHRYNHRGKHLEVRRNEHGRL